MCVCVHACVWCVTPVPHRADIHSTHLEQEQINRTSRGRELWGAARPPVIGTATRGPHQPGCGAGHAARGPRQPHVRVCEEGSLGLTGPAEWIREVTPPSSVREPRLRSRWPEDGSRRPSRPSLVERTQVPPPRHRDL